MSLFRLLQRSLRRHSLLSHLAPLTSVRTFAFSSAEEAAAERRRRKRRLRIEPPLYALRRDPSIPRPPPDPNARPLPDSTSALTGPRLAVHNRVQSLIRAGDLDSAAAAARRAVFSHTRPTVFTCNAIVAGMYRAERYSEAVSYFHFFFNQSGIVPNVVSYNFLIVAHCESGEVDVGLEVYRKIIAEAPFSPSSVTYRHLTQGLIDSGRIGEAVSLLREMLTKGLGADSLVFNNLIKGFLDLGDFDKANELFDELKERCLVYDGIVNATFMEWFFSQGRAKEAMESYRSLLDRQFKMVPATCNVLLEVLLKHGKKKEAWELFDSMLDNHTPPTFHAVNSDTFNIMINECFKEGKIDEAIATFRKAGTKRNSRPFSMDVAGYSNIIVRFAERGMIPEAEKFFDELISKALSSDVTGYRTLIDAYLKEDRIDDALNMFHRMVDANLRIIPLYANKWFTELIKSDKAKECVPILTKMGEKEPPKPDATTYEIVVKGLCEIGALDLVVDVVGQSMRYDVGVVPSLREFLIEVFEKEGRREELERVLDDRRREYWEPPHPQPLGLPRFAAFGQEVGPTPTGFRPKGAFTGDSTSYYYQTTSGPTPTGFRPNGAFTGDSTINNYQTTSGSTLTGFRPNGTFTGDSTSNNYQTTSGPTPTGFRPNGAFTGDSTTNDYQATSGPTPTGCRPNGAFTEDSTLNNYQTTSGPTPTGFRPNGAFTGDSTTNDYQATSGPTPTGFRPNVAFTGDSTINNYRTTSGPTSTGFRPNGPFTGDSTGNNYQTTSGPSHTGSRPYEGFTGKY